MGVWIFYTMPMHLINYNGFVGDIIMGSILHRIMPSFLRNRTVKTANKKGVRLSHISYCLPMKWPYGRYVPVLGGMRGVALPNMKTNEKLELGFRV